MNARQVALQALIAYRREGAWSESFLKKTIKNNKLEQRDAALATTICYGVLQNCLLLDFYIDFFSSVKKINPKIRDILRIGAYQIVFLDRVPHSAAVNEAVKMARKDNPKAAGFVNAILRKISLEKGNLPQPKGSQVEKISVLTSHPQWLVKRYIDTFGDQAEKLLLANNCVPDITARVNTFLTDTDTVIKELEKQNVKAVSHEWLSDCVVISNPGNIEELFAYKRGLITVQDVASQIAALSAQVSPGMCVLDACAAPGGKSFVLAQKLNNTGKVYSCDIHIHKIDILKRGKERLGLSCVSEILQDASEFKPEWENKFDVVLADVPCSGLGIIRKKPDVRYKKEEEIKSLPKLQSKILQNASRYVKKGGILVYSTCTVLPEENGDITRRFLSQNPEFEYASFSIPGSGEFVKEDVTLLPTTHGTDGFYICRMRKKG